MPRDAGARRRRRLSSSGDFRRVYGQGSSRANRHLVLYRFEDDSDRGARLGISVSRKVGDSVVRNRVKRVLGEAFWAEVEGDPDHDFVLVARPPVAALIEEKGLGGAREALRELLADSGSERST